MVAGLAHEIRNPLGAMRLKAENALAGEHERHVPALNAILAQIRRPEALLARLFSLVRSIQPDIQNVEVNTWLKENSRLACRTGSRCRNRSDEPIIDKPMAL